MLTNISMCSANRLYCLNSAGLNLGNACSSFFGGAATELGTSHIGSPSAFILSNGSSILIVAYGARQVDAVVVDAIAGIRGSGVKCAAARNGRRKLESSRPLTSSRNMGVGGHDG